MGAKVGTNVSGAGVGGVRVSPAGSAVGTTVGATVGAIVGAIVGTTVGARVGGIAVGAMVGARVVGMAILSDGVCVGSIDISVGVTIILSDNDRVALSVTSASGTVSVKVTVTDKVPDGVADGVAVPSATDAKHNIICIIDIVCSERRHFCMGGGVGVCGWKLGMREGEANVERGFLYHWLFI